MNRSIAECWSHALSADQQGEVFHRYILGLYDLYERLIAKFPHVRSLRDFCRTFSTRTAAAVHAATVMS